MSTSEQEIPEAIYDEFREKAQKAVNREFYVMSDKSISFAEGYQKALEDEYRHLKSLPDQTKETVLDQIPFDIREFVENDSSGFVNKMKSWEPSSRVQYAGGMYRGAMNLYNYLKSSGLLYSPPQETGLRENIAARLKELEALIKMEKRERADLPKGSANHKQATANIEEYRIRYDELNKLPWAASSPADKLEGEKAQAIEKHLAGKVKVGDIWIYPGQFESLRDIVIAQQKVICELKEQLAAPLGEAGKFSWNKKEVIGLMAETAYHVQKHGHGGCSISHHLASLLFDKFVLKKDLYNLSDTAPPNNSGACRCDDWLSKVTEVDKARFWSKCVQTRYCWEWTEGKSDCGYGMFKVQGRDVIASRLAYQLVNGEIADNLEVCHKCDNPGCINPDHLFTGTHQDNMKDMMRKGRGKVLGHSSRYLGVSWRDDSKNWRAAIRIDKKMKSLGAFPTQEQAARRRDQEIIALGIDAPLNFPTDRSQDLPSSPSTSK